VLGDSQAARGVDLSSPPRGVPLPPLSLGARAGIALGAVALATVLAVEIATASYLADLVYVPAWRPIYAFARGWL
jgi:hypothetical protein